MVAVLRKLIHVPTVESYCVPNFDSPSVFARILDKDKVHFISPSRKSVLSLDIGWPLLNHSHHRLYDQAGVYAEFECTYEALSGVFIFSN